MTISFRLLILLFVSGLYSIGAVASHDADLSKAEVMQLVVDEAVRQSFPPQLALAVARTESNFNPSAVSHVGAIGVMQIMPRTARLEFGVAEKDLYNAEINIRTGITFLKSLNKRYGRMDIALSHYNGGSAVQTSAGTLRVIPATRQYVNLVQDRAATYASHSLVSKASEYEYAVFKGGETPSGMSSMSYSKAKTMARTEREKTIENLQSLAARNLKRGYADPMAERLMSGPSRHRSGDRKTQLIAKWESVYDN